MIYVATLMLLFGLAVVAGNIYALCVNRQRQQSISYIPFLGLLLVVLGVVIGAPSGLPRWAVVVVLVGLFFDPGTNLLFPFALRCIVDRIRRS
ncbi:MAG: hypothetical protein H6815_04290 [Phycisphaeraceae bacterium]|nr:hypothetical protein [Phycisphaerales bacterium]MCB9859651.1 hypothetical protein [Phycisphaeraceae bacterium]